jgi:hypothetical protein
VGDVQRNCLAFAQDPDAANVPAPNKPPGSSINVCTALPAHSSAINAARRGRLPPHSCTCLFRHCIVTRAAQSTVSRTNKTGWAQHAHWVGVFWVCRVLGTACAACLMLGPFGTISHLLSSPADSAVACTAASRAHVLLVPPERGGVGPRERVKQVAVLHELRDDAQVAGRMQSAHELQEQRCSTAGGPNQYRPRGKGRTAYAAPRGIRSFKSRNVPGSRLFHSAITACHGASKAQHSGVQRPCAAERGIYLRVLLVHSSKGPHSSPRLQSRSTADC